MSRKSLPKKTNPQPLWYECESCSTSFAYKDCDKHTGFCESNEKHSEPGCPFIKNGKLLTGNFECLEDAKIVIAELELLPEKQKNSLVFMGEGAMRLCKIKTGESISLSLPNAASFSPLIRMAWPLEGKYLGQLYFAREDYELNFSQWKEHKVLVQKLHDDPMAVSEITLENITESYDSEVIVAMELPNQIRFFLCNRIFTLGAVINYNLFNKRIKLQIKSHQPVVKQKKSLEKQFEDLSIDRHKYLWVTKKTKINVVDKIDEAKLAKSEIEISIGLSDVGGLDNIIGNIRDNISVALGLSNLPCQIKISRGILLYGPSGCGKSLLAEALANELTLLHQIEVIKIKSNEIFSKFFGETERNLQNKFEQAFASYPKPSLIVLEDINNICPKHENNDIVKRVSIAFLNLLDSLHLKAEGSKTFIIATTNNIDNLNLGLRRCGRFDNEIEIAAPNPESRYEILKKNLYKVEHTLTDSEIREIANITHGFVGSDLANLIYKAAIHCLSEASSTKSVSLKDINSALNHVKPSAMRQVMIESPNVKWDEIGGQHDLKLKLKQSIEWPLLYPDKFKKLGIKPPRGILMFGPPGCSKTMIAKALATESQVNFLSIKGPELFSMWVGESERAVREVFRKARQVAPAIIFFDEIDAIGGERSSDGQSSSVKERVLTQLLTELDGVDTLKDVTIVAATNRPDMIDKALLRPGRFDRLVYVGLPDHKTREEIFKIKLKQMPIASDVRLDNLINRTHGYSGAEIQAVCHEAALKTLEEDLDANEVSWKHFEIALNTVKPRTSKDLIALYEAYIKNKM